jgi:hypothetical protein
MNFEKGNKKNRKITFSVTLSIMLLAASVAISISIVTKEALGQNPYDTVNVCFKQNGSLQDQGYITSVGHFESAIHNDQVFVNVAKSINLPLQSTVDLSVLIAKQNYLSEDNVNKIFDEIDKLLASSGFNADQQNNLDNCFGNIPTHIGS